MKTRRNTRTGTLAGLILAGVVLLAGTTPAVSFGETGETGTAPDFTLQDIDSGETVSLSDFRGRWVLLEFWATW